MTVPFYRPPKILAIEELLPDWAAVYDSGMLSNGNNCRELEEEIKLIHKCDHVITCSSATSGLWILLKVLKTKSILMPSFTWKSVGSVTEQYHRVFMDIDRETWLPNPFQSPKNHSFPDTVLLQHTFGSIMKPSLKVKEKIVYDAAYSLGLEFPVNDGAVISLSPTKTVTGCEGGLILLNDDKIACEIEKLRDSCARLSELNAVVALHYLEKLNEILARKKQIFEYYRQKLPWQYQKILVDTTYGYYGMLLELSNERFRDTPGSPVFSINNVECRVRYEPLQKGCINTDYVAGHLVCLPCYHDVNEKDVVERLLSTDLHHVGEPE